MSNVGRKFGEPRRGGAGAVYWIKAGLLLGSVIAAGAAPLRADTQPPVTVIDEGETLAIANGLVSARVKKSNANLLSLRFRDVEFISRGQGYWNIYGRSPGGANTEVKPAPSVVSITHDPRANGGQLGEIAIRFPYRGQQDAVPLSIEIRYTLHRGDTALYGWTIAEHQPGDPPFAIEQATVVLKLNPDAVDFLTVDSRRRLKMVTGEDWVRGEPLNLKEARRMTTGERKGLVEHKYDYSALFSETPAYGWTSTRNKVGLWLINPSLEYINGGPIKVALTGHIDGKSKLPADPTLLFNWHSCHYGGKPMPIEQSERWRKVVGPFAFYCNSGADHEQMWHDALARARREQESWPYDWARAEGYTPRAERSVVRGRLKIADADQPMRPAAGAWVGLTADPYEAVFDRLGKLTIDWQIDGKHYQYWTRADADGAFAIANVRPGEYRLCAFVDGVLGEFEYPHCPVGTAQTIDLDELEWKPRRFGRQLWEIGVPNRSAAEFRHGDHYWQWGLYHLYPKEFPDDVDFVVGKSDWSRDWNYAQPPRPDGRGGWKPTTWRIRFTLPEQPVGTAILRMAICGVRGGPIDVAVNGQPAGSTGPLPESGVMHRDGIRGVQIERDIRFDARLLRAGENVMELCKQARTWTDGVLYDYLRLEIAPASSAAPASANAASAAGETGRGTGGPVR